MYGVGGKKNTVGARVHVWVSFFSVVIIIIIIIKKKATATKLVLHFRRTPNWPGIFYAYNLYLNTYYIAKVF